MPKELNSRSSAPSGGDEAQLSPSANAPNNEFPTLLAFGEGLYPQQILQAIPAPLYICDLQGRITFFNQSAVELWGRTPTLGVDLWSGSFRIYRTDGSPMPLDEYPMAIAIKEGRPVRDVEVIVEQPNGNRRHILPFPSPIRDASGRMIGAINMLVDVTNRRQEIMANKAADIVQAKLAAIVESSDDAIISKTLDGIITSWNGGAQRLFGYSAEETIGKSILLIVPSDRRDEEADIIRRLRLGQRIEHFETQRLARDGRLLEISLTVSPIRDSTGVIVGASKVARDITEKKYFDQEREKLLDAERYAREEAQRANRMKDDFLATLSHELRTPLNAVMGWAQLLAAGNMNSDEMTDAGKIIERNARLQKQLIEDLLDMSRIISGKLRLDVQSLDPVFFIAAAIEIVQPSADAKNIRLEKMFDSKAGPISGDPARLQQVVWNLLTNAVKFTPAGGRVRVQLQRVNSHIELTVSDTGQGIKPEFLPHLFARFSQADSSANRTHGGLGLGLAIVRQLVELHGGSIRATSPGQAMGSSFIICLPLLSPNSVLEEPRIDPVALASPPTHRVDLTGLKVLLVDDESDAREFVKRLLVESGANVLTAASASTAIPLLEQSPDLLVSDIGMPTVDGYELLRQIRKLNNPIALHIPAIALTAFARSEDRTRALRAGFIAHVAKPIEPSELLATIAVVSGRIEQFA